MSTFDPSIRSALDRLAPPDTREPDWPDVLARASQNGHAPFEAARIQFGTAQRTRPRSRRLLVAAALLVVVLIVVFATPAFGLRSKILTAFDSSPRAPEQVALNFGELDRGAPVDMGPGTIAEESREVLRASALPGSQLVLYVTPTRTGGYCTATEIESAATGAATTGGGVACRTRNDIASRGIAATVSLTGPVSSEGVVQGPVTIDGSTGLEAAATVEVVFEDGASETVDLTWVSEPIDAGFFAFVVPRANLERGHRPIVLVVRDGDGDEVARDDETLRMALLMSLP